MLSKHKTHLISLLDNSEILHFTSAIFLSIPLATNSRPSPRSASHPLQQFIDVRLVVLGNAEVGKSTLLGVLTYSQLDNGRGRSRLNLFRYLHEIQSGRTSSISHEVIGYDHAGKVCRSKLRPPGGDTGLRVGKGSAVCLRTLLMFPTKFVNDQLSLPTELLI